MTADDQSDYERLKKLLDRLGKAVVTSAESETSEIIRRHEPGLYVVTNKRKGPNRSVLVTPI